MSAVTLPPNTALGNILDPTAGLSPTTALRFWRRIASAVGVYASRFSKWHALEPRADALASYAALGIGCLAAVGALVIL